MKKYLSKLPHFIILFIAVFYWGSTILYCSPNNYIRISHNLYMHFFEIFLYQKWTFFAPPPEHNERLYLTFLSKADSSKTLAVMEVTTYINQAKQKNAPFNSKEEVVDYIISNSVNDIANNLRKSYNIVQETYPDSSKVFLTKKSMEKFNTYLLQIRSIKTILNFAKIVALKNSIDCNKTLLKITLTRVKIPKFKDRETGILRLEEDIIYYSPLLKIK